MMKKSKILKIFKMIEKRSEMLELNWIMIIEAKIDQKSKLEYVEKI